MRRGGSGREGDVRPEMLLVVMLTSGCAVGMTSGEDDDFDSHESFFASGGGGSSSASGTGGAATTSATSTTATTTGSGGTGPATSSASVSSTAATTGAGGGSTCDNQLDCDTCTACAQNSVCLAAIDACFNDTQCYDLVDCVNTCADEVCMNDCADQNPAGMVLYMGAIECMLCTACPNDCANEGMGLCI